ncbi:integrase catalytic domain-containing protein [Trichonephila inaurata madagascariensis]|uniref:Integrase catalytic domain-containing protein n=1 Tax=Trichonephila inaurata madagascariensis TaxID=2747483 RepID=A0A8X6Y629_9ARAC|nr:integrase catalytic domain-containing protein [Trichonephila inaurata madagascariensis]
MSMLSNQILSLDVKESWSLENIGIRDPVENLKERELNSKSIKRFENKLNILLDGRPELTPAKTTKKRSVFDAIASGGEGGERPLLNDMLQKSPSLIELIPDILDRFHLYPIGLSANIEKAFLQLAIASEHNSFLSS